MFILDKTKHKDNFISIIVIPLYFRITSFNINLNYFLIKFKLLII